MQDQIAGVMYPRMGEMVRRYVSSAIRDMMQEINRRLEAGLTHNRFFLWIRSVTSGRSMAELALAETQQLEVEEIYLVRRGSGVLVHHWQRPGASNEAGGGNRDTLVSGFLAAITALAEEAFEADRESLRTLDLDDHRIYLRGSPDYLLAAKCSGFAPAGIDRNLDGELIRVLADNQDIERSAAPRGGETAIKADRNALLAEFSANIEQAARDRKTEISRDRGMRALKTILWLIGLPLAALAAWHLYLNFVTHSLQSKADAAIAGIAELKGYPVKAHVERGGNRIWLTGLAPDEATREKVLSAVRDLSPETEVSEGIGVLPKADVEIRLTAEGFRRAVGRADGKLASLGADLSGLQHRLAGSPEGDALKQAEEATHQALAELRKPRADSALDRPDTALRATYERLADAAGKLAPLAGSNALPPQSAPRDAIQGIDALALAADRITALASTIEQRRAIAPVSERIAVLERNYRARLDELEKRLDAQQPPPQTPRQRAAAFVRTHALFFSNESQYRDDRAAGRTLDTLAELMRGNDIVLRVVGYTDEVGTAARNSPLSQARADKVVADLVTRGIPPSRLIAVGRLNSVPIAQGSGAESPNRRVEFEIAFDGEKGGKP
jgi:outer membrane protein OmpA-like peptidoglycan-associated protein